MITKHSQLKVIVLRPLETLPVPGANEIPVSGDRLYTFATDAINVKDGFGGFYKEWNDPVTYGLNSGNPEAVDGTGDVTASIKFIQNRDTSQDASPLYERPLEESQWIAPFCINGVKIQGQAVSQPSNNMIVAGPAAGGQPVPVLDEFTYRVQVSGHGDRTDMNNSTYNTPTTFGTFTSPDWTNYTFTGVLTNDEEATAITIESLANNFNAHSQSMSFMICIDSAATVATGSITLANLINPATYPNGSKIIIGYDKQGNPATFKMDNSYREALTQFNTAVPGTSLRPYLLPATVNAPAGVPVAGDAVPTDHFAVLSIDEGQAYFDYKINTKRRINLGLLKGFDNVAQVTVALPVEGTGTARQLEIFFKANEQYNQTARPQPYMSYHVQFGNEIIKNATYDIFVIEHCHMRTATSGLPAQMPHTTMIAVVSYEDPNTPYFEAAGAGLPNPQKTYIQDVLNEFNTNFNLGNPTLAL